MFQFLIEGTSKKRYKIQLPAFLFLAVFLSIFTAATIFCDFLEFHLTFIWKKIFITNFPCLIRFTKTLHPLIAEQLKSAKRDESFLLILFPIEVI